MLLRTDTLCPDRLYQLYGEDCRPCSAGSTCLSGRQKYLSLRNNHAFRIAEYVSRAIAESRILAEPRYQPASISGCSRLYAGISDVKNHRGSVPSCSQVVRGNVRNHNLLFSHFMLQPAPHHHASNIWPLQTELLPVLTLSSMAPMRSTAATLQEPCRQNPATPLCSSMSAAHPPLWPAMAENHKPVPVTQ